MGAAHCILDHIAAVLSKLDQTDPDATGRLAQITLQAQRVFLVGAGRSGLMAKAFAMRLMHLGLQAYVAGESTTPSLEAGDAVIIVSSSGRTASILAITERVSQSGAAMVLLTSAPDAPMRAQCSDTILIPCANHPDDCTLMPLGSIFEIATLIYLETTIAAIKERLGVSHHDMRKRHTILE